MKWFTFWLWLVCLSTWNVDGTSSSEGTKFAIALSPSAYDYYHVELIINARETTDVTITTSSTSEVMTVYGNWSLKYGLNYHKRTINGIENKGILVTSVKPVTIHVATVSSYYSYSTPDACIVRPVSDSSVEYFLAGYGDFYTGSTPPHAFYMIVATEDNTEVDVHYPDAITLEDEHFTLNQYEVFTIDTNKRREHPEIDFTGTRVLATKPVGVYSGVGWARINAPGANALLKYVFESMPTLDDLGTEYTSFPIHYGGDGGYEVRVIAVADDTDVSFHAFSAPSTLNTGEFYVVDNSVTRFGFKLSCSKPCMVVQYVRSLPAGGDTGLKMSGFLAVLTPDDRATNNLIFTVPTMIDHSSDMTAAIAIIVNTFPVTGLHLNDTSLAGLNWQAVGDSPNSYATVEVDTGFYQLYSTVPSERFTAYLYVLPGDPNLHPAVGFPIGYADGTNTE